MKLIRFTTAESPNPSFGVVIRDQAVPFAYQTRIAINSIQMNFRLLQKMGQGSGLKLLTGLSQTRILASRKLSLLQGILQKLRL